jgi:anti-sigma regulatory factor (Ser/Thr protein kinase)/anti-anti-sigma regulatory factor
VCQLTVERLTRAGYYDDVTALAAQRLAVPVPELHLELPGERPSLTIAREAFTDWLGRLGAAAEDREGLHLAMVEIFTNAIEHAYPAGVRGSVELDAILDDTGQVSCRIADHGRWRPPDPAQAGHGHGLMVAGQVVDTIVVSRAPQPGDDARDGAAPAADGTVVKLLHRLHRPAVVASDQASAAAAVSRARGPEPAFSVDTSVDDGNARAKVRGPVDITTADQLTRRLLSACRGGTLSLIVDLTKLTQLASAGVRALFRIRELLAAHQQHLTLITAPGSSAHAVLDLVHLPHVAQPDLA